MRLKTINVGLVGAGAMGKVHALAFKAVTAYDPSLPPIRLRVVAEADAALARRAAEALGFEAWTADWQSLVGDPEVNVVSVAAPNDLHAPVAISAARAGKHVLCEKPLATRALEAQEMWRVAEACGIVHMVNFNYRQLPAVRLARRLVEQGRIGAVRQFRGAYLQDWGNDPEVPYSWKFQARHSGSGVLAGIGSHVVDLARYLVGEPAGVVADTRVWVPERPAAGLATGTDTRRPVDVEDTACALVRFHGGALGLLEVSRCAPGRKNHLAFEIHGESGSLIFDGERPNELCIYVEGERETEGFRRVLLGPAHSSRIPLSFPGIPVGFVETVVFQLQDFLRAVVGGGEATPNFHDGWRVQVVMEAILESAQAGGWISVIPGAAESGR